MPEERRKRKVVAITLDDLIHEEAKIQAKKEGMNLSRLIEWLLNRYLAEQKKRRSQQIEEQRIEEKGQLVAERFMKKLIFDETYRSDEWTQVA